MENNSGKELPVSYATKRGDGPHSYAKNSSIQGVIIEAAKKLIQDSIAENFDPKALSGSSAIPICIADLGCSTGPNTYIAVQHIIEAIELQYQSHSLPVPEFQVFFSDQVLNDFNRLFRNLPLNRNYFAAGVPGSFYGRLFPKGSICFFHSSSALYSLSALPEEITEENSASWNKGRIHCANASKEVFGAYSNQYQKDMETFLHCRAEELVGNGLMVLQVPTTPDVILDPNVYSGKDFELLGSCLVDMAKVGLVSEEKVDSFNLPIFHSTATNLKAIFERNDDFIIERMETLGSPNLFPEDVHIFVKHWRAGLEGIVASHFGEGIVDELFGRFTKKVVETPEIVMETMQTLVVLFVLLKRKPHA